MGSVYTSTLRVEIREAKRKLAEAEKNYLLLINKGSEYADDILAWIDVKKKVLKVYEDSRLDL